jgi:hypothetical protein
LIVTLALLSTIFVGTLTRLEKEEEKEEENAEEKETPLVRGRRKKKKKKKKKKKRPFYYGRSVGGVPSGLGVVLLPKTCQTVRFWFGRKINDWVVVGWLVVVVLLCCCVCCVVVLLCD